MNTAAARVRDVRGQVRDMVRAFALRAAGVCGMCGIAASRGRGRSDVHINGASVTPRAYRVPHIPHVPHIACSAWVSSISTAARYTAHPARLLARAFSSVIACLKEKKEVDLYGF